MKIGDIILDLKNVFNLINIFLKNNIFTNYEIHNKKLKNPTI